MNAQPARKKCNMSRSTGQLKIGHSRKANYLFYMCLLDWGGAVLDETVHKAVAQSIMPDGEQMDGWYVTGKDEPQLQAHGVKSRFFAGFYHSRIILQFELTDCPETISKVREIRLAIGDFVEYYLRKSVLPVARIASGIHLKAFIYPVFELKARGAFWKTATTIPYILTTTCFFTDLRDPEEPRWGFLRIRGLRRLAKTFLPATVTMRISGAQLVTSPMSEWFFVNLTNLIYHEGLYRMSREQRLKRGQVWKGLEVRLEDFADKLMAAFSQSIANVVQRTQTWLIVLLTVVLIGFTIGLIVVSICN